MRNLFPLALALLTLLAAPSSAHARGRGVRSFLVTADGKVAAELGETRSDLLDPAALVRYRYHEGRITAAPLDKPDTVLWTAAVNATMQGYGPAWRLLPTVIVILGENQITGIDPTTGKTRYTTPSEHFTDSPASVRYLADDPQPSLLLIDDRALREQLRRDQPNKHPPATLARFDLTSGKFLWKTAIITPTGLKLRPMGLNPLGSIEGEQEGEEFFFDPATGKALDRAPFASDTPRDLPLPRRAGVQATTDKIEYLDAAGKVLWSRAEPGAKGDALLTADSVVIPCVTERSQTQVIAFDLKDGKERWRCPLLGGFFADQVVVKIQTAKQGYLVHVEWLVLD